MNVLDPTTGEICHVNGSIGSGGQGTINYEELENKPSINDQELDGNLTTEDLNIDFHDIKNKPTINNISIEGDLTTADLEISVQAKYTPQGTISKPSAVIENSVSTNINGIADVGSLPTMKIKNGVLSFDMGTLPTKTEDIEVIIDPGNVNISKPIFTGVQSTITSTALEE